MILLKLNEQRDISIWQDIDLTNNIWETEERSFRQKLNDSWDTEANNSVWWYMKRYIKY